MKKLLLAVLVVILGAGLNAQPLQDSIPLRPRQTIGLTMLGDASGLSLGYERLFVLNDKLILSAKAGIGFNSSFFQKKKYVTLPQHVTFNFGKDVHLFEFGLGGAFLARVDDLRYYMYPILGYRSLPLATRGVYVRMYMLYPFPGYNKAFEADLFIVPGGFSMGYSF